VTSYVAVLLAAVEGVIVALLAGLLLRSKAQLRERTRELRHLQRLHGMGEMAARIAHDVNNMGTVVLANTELLERTAADERIREAGAAIQEAVEHVTALTKRLRTLARAQPCDPRVIDLHALVDGARPLLKSLAGSQVELTVAARAVRAEVRGDPTALEQLLFNLVANAHDAMPEGGRVTIATSDAAPDAVELCVEDTGIGMDEATRARVFEPFFTTKSTGTGLGLAVVNGIVYELGGDITVASQPGKGTTFRVRLPLVKGGTDAA
jgi:signal transduction histidine kinase